MSVELVRQEIRLRLEIAAHELGRLIDDDAPAREIAAKIAEWKLIEARRIDLERRFP